MSDVQRARHVVVRESFAEVRQEKTEQRRRLRLGYGERRRRRAEWTRKKSDIDGIDEARRSREKFIRRRPLRTLA